MQALVYLSDQRNIKGELSVNDTRRKLITGMSIAGVGALLVSCQHNAGSGATNREGKDADQSSDEIATSVSATEDLMREHGLMRRALLVYQESAAKLKLDANSVPTESLEKVAQFFRAFGEDYHERKLEEAYILPAIKKSQNPASSYADVLLAQHARGREITDYLLSISKGQNLPSASVSAVINALESFVRMYEHHAAIEDTIVFPAWKEVTGSKELDELAIKFEEIEEEHFGEDGFGAASRRMAEIEESLGLSNLQMFTAPPPPGRS
jgi:hemerythrin-like domain-containing protein